MNNQKGVSLYITIALVFVFLSIILGVSTILLGQIKIIRSIEDSVIALYAAESGIERVLVQRFDPLSLDGVSDTLSNGSSYIVEVFSSGVGGCSAANYCINSLGTYRNARRAIQVSY